MDLVKRLLAPYCWLPPGSSIVLYVAAWPSKKQRLVLVPLPWRTLIS